MNDENDEQSYDEKLFFEVNKSVVVSDQKGIMLTQQKGSVLYEMPRVFVVHFRWHLRVT